MALIEPKRGSTLSIDDLELLINESGYDEHQLDHPFDIIRTSNKSTVKLSIVSKAEIYGIYRRRLIRLATKEVNPIVFGSDTFLERLREFDGTELCMSYIQADEKIMYMWFDALGRRLVAMLIVRMAT